MKNLLYTLLLFCAGHLTAQPVITLQNLLEVGDVVVTQPCNTTNFHPGAAGANQNWDFSQLVPEGPQDTTFYLSPAGSPYAASYPSSNILSRFGDGYGYYQTTATQLFFWGQSDPSSALVLTDPAVYFRSPMTYGTVVLDTIAGSLNAPPLSGSLTGQVYLSGDGYGSLLTPGGAYTEVLRVRTVTVGVVTVPFFGAITDSVFNYSWYKPGIQTPVLEMIDDTQWAGGTVVAQTRYVNYFNSLTSKTAEPGQPDAPVIRAYPNPTNGLVRFSGLEHPARIVVRNAAGQTVLAESLAAESSVDFKNLGAGVYFCTVFSGEVAPQQLKIVVE